MSAGPVCIDLRPSQQPAYRERGVARYTLETARALVARHPELIGDLLLDTALPPVGDMEPLVAAGARPARGWRGTPGGVLHVTSPFGLEAGLGEVWPRAAVSAGMRLVVTVYDLIPDIFAGEYLADPGVRRRWRARRELVRAADHVLTLSRSSAADIVERLGVPARRVSVAGAGCDRRFSPPAPGEEPLAEARRLVPGLEERFAVYNGAADPRKNMERLMQAWAAVDPGARGACQLVVVGRLDGLQRNHYEVLARRLGIAGDVLFAGVVTDEALTRLYQATQLMIFPSLYEGYGLPVVEAQACGAPVVASATSSIAELIDPDAGFDPYDVRSIAAAVERVLGDEQARGRLKALAARARPTWDEVADRTAEVYREVAGTARVAARRPRQQGPRRGALALVSGSPLWSPGDEALAAALSEQATVDCYAPDGSAPDPQRPRRRPLAALGRLSAVRGGYRAVVVTVGDDPGSAGGLVALRRAAGAGLPVITVARRLGATGLVEAYRALGELPGALAAQYPALDLDSPPAGSLLLGEAAALSRRLLVPSPVDANRARSQLEPPLAGRVEAVAPSVAGQPGEREWCIAVLEAAGLTG